MRRPILARHRAVEFLVEIEAWLPPELDDGARACLVHDEFARGTELARAGLLRAIWRVPGRLANRGIWTVDDATDLHAALVSSPLWPYMEVAVTPLAHHPLSDSCGGLAAVRGGGRAPGG